MVPAILTGSQSLFKIKIAPNEKSSKGLDMNFFIKILFIFLTYSCSSGIFQEVDYDPQTVFMRFDKSHNRTPSSKKKRGPQSFSKVVKLKIKDIPERSSTSVYFPKSYKTSKKKFPLVLSLHGYKGGRTLQNLYLPLFRHVNSKKFILMVPEGVKDEKNFRFWNASKFCCDFGKRNIDDAQFLKSLLDHAKKYYKVDPSKIFIFGHSNGGFMAYRMACKYPDEITGIASLAGASPKNDCRPKHGVKVLQIHGTKDDVIKYEGNEFHLGAQETVKNWVTFNQCEENEGQPLKRKIRKKGIGPFFTEINSTIWNKCWGPSVELWTVENGNHAFPKSNKLTRKVLDYFF